MRVQNSTIRYIRSNGTGIVVLCCVLAGACKKEAPLPPLPPPPVSTAKVVKAESARTLRMSGTLEAERSVSLGFSVPGTVEQVLVKEGESVKRGQVLARLLDRSYRDSLGIAKAKADQAEDAYRRLAPMFHNKTLPEVKMVEVETGLSQARLSLSMAHKNLEDTVLRAPEDGVIARRQIEAGANAAPAVPVFTLVRTQILHATASVPEKDIGRFKKGDSAQVVVPALNKTVTGAIHEIAVLANPLTRSYDVKVAVSNREGDMRVGMVAEIHLNVVGDSPALAVPPEAVRVDESGKPCVFVAMGDQTVRRRPVTVAGYAGENVAVVAGVNEGDEVVVSNTPMLADGMRVRR